MPKQEPAFKPENIQIPEVYANTAMVNFNPYEFEITFGLGSANYDGVKPVVNARMSPQFAKELAAILTENVSRYEEMVGAIPQAEEKKRK
ncbi:MAG: DUF3467 domain-containing protein [Bacteroidales bacterium]